MKPSGNFSSCALAVNDNVMVANARNSTFFIIGKCYLMNVFVIVRMNARRNLQFMFAKILKFSAAIATNNLQLLFLPSK
jgi:hypothetical protein